MFSLFSSRSPVERKLECEGGLALWPYTSRDFYQWQSLRLENREFLQPYEPRWMPSELKRKSFRKRLLVHERQARAGTAFHWLIWLGDDAVKSRAGATLIGGISVSHIRYGASRTGTIGYWLGRQFTGNGYMKISLGRVVEHCFNDLELMRLEAGCLPNNLPSQGVLKHCGFVEEGCARGYLSINGVRRDHLIYSHIQNDGCFASE